MIKSEREEVLKTVEFVSALKVFLFLKVVGMDDFQEKRKLSKIVGNCRNCSKCINAQI